MGKEIEWRISRTRGKMAHAIFFGMWSWGEERDEYQTMCAKRIGNILREDMWPKADKEVPRCKTCLKFIEREREFEKREAERRAQNFLADLKKDVDREIKEAEKTITEAARKIEDLKKMFAYLSSVREENLEFKIGVVRTLDNIIVNCRGPLKRAIEEARREYMKIEGRDITALTRFRVFVKYGNGDVFWEIPEKLFKVML